MAFELTRERLAEAEDAVRLGLAELEQLAARAAETAERLARSQDPHYLEVYGAAALLHAYYNQIEQLFERIARDLNSAPPEGPDWHRRLLESMAAERSGTRPAVLDAGALAALREYLGFRHVFRKLYILNLRWPRVRELLAGLVPAHAQVAADLRRFSESLQALRDSLAG